MPSQSQFAGILVLGQQGEVGVEGVVVVDEELIAEDVG